MEVSTCKCLISIFLAVTLCQAAGAVEQIGLLPCIEGGSGSMLHCIEYDSVGDISYLHDNITRRITVKLPLVVLTQLWNNQGEIAIVDVDGVVINNGQELISSQDRDRWTIEFNFQRVNSDIGKLQLLLHITDVEYRDEQYFHVEIRAEDIIFATRKKIWIPVEVKSSENDNDREGEAITPENPAEDPSAILHSRIEELQKEKETLEEEKETLIHYQAKYHRCLESKDDLKGTTKPEFDGKGLGQIHLHVDITTLIILLLCTAVVIMMIYIVFILKGSMHVRKTSHLERISANEWTDLPPHSSITFNELNIGEDLLLIKKE